MKTISFFLILVFSLVAHCSPLVNKNFALSPLPKALLEHKTTFNPPKIHSDSYILIDANTGTILAEKNSSMKKHPASLTKMLTMYVVSDFLDKQQIHLDDKVCISKKAWQTGGSRSFVKEGQYLKIEDLIKGIIVQSGNDATIAIAEYISGSEDAFVNLLNNQAKTLGMNDSHFSDPTGISDQNQYTTAQDLAILSRALIADFPQYYSWYKQKTFTLNDITQHNRNRLLWRVKEADGIKTGISNKAGYVLSVSAKKDKTRLIAIVMNAPSDEARALDGKRLLNYGFRFFETSVLFTKHQTIAKIPVWFGTKNSVSIGLDDDLQLTIPKEISSTLTAKLNLTKALKAPLSKGNIIGKLDLKKGNTIIKTLDLVALEDIPKGSIFKRTTDLVRYSFNRIYKKLF